MALSPCKDACPHFTPVSAQIPATETLVTTFLQPDCLTAKSLSVPSLCLCVLMVGTYMTVTQLHKGRKLLSEMSRSQQDKSCVVPFPEVPGASSSWRREAEGWVPGPGLVTRHRGRLCRARSALEAGRAAM